MNLNLFEKELNVLFEKYGFEINNQLVIKMDGGFEIESAIPGPIMPKIQYQRETQKIKIEISANIVGEWKQSNKRI